MSLDVYLELEPQENVCTCPNCENRHTVMVAPVVFSSNITHNLNRMAEAAGIYDHLWRPDEIGVDRARDLIEPLRQGLEKLRADPDYYRGFDAVNGWGRYEHFVPWVAEYLAACEENPDSKVWVSR